MFGNYEFDLMIREIDVHTPLVVMMSGVTGSVKKAFSKRLEREGFVRFSIDEGAVLVW
ncbi:MAG: hypothetical protein AB2411_15415 [Mesobacillus sp.]